MSNTKIFCDLAKYIVIFLHEFVPGYRDKIGVF